MDDGQNKSRIMKECRWIMDRINQEQSRYYMMENGSEEIKDDNGIDG